ncbi:MAG: helix-turn-helix transcriptional regulator [Bacteroidia bacterium]|nr:helix-turn-helix transcriptional regulator [Bacteroidia bacterium]
MNKKHPILLPKTQRILIDLGQNIKLARLRRKYTMEQVAERANIARSTLWLVEKGNSGVSIGTYLQILFVLGLEKDFCTVAQNDPLGRKLQDAQLIMKERGKKKQIKS